VSIVLLTGLLFLVIRRKNVISLELEDDEDYDDDEIELLEEDEIPISKPQPISYNQNILEEEEEVIQRDLNIKDKLPNNRKTFSLDEDQEQNTQPKRRRVSNTNRNKQGPIMTTKRKVLGGENPTQKTKKVNIKTVKKEVKTRKVRKTKIDSED
jgi:hypothetical protein